MMKYIFISFCYIIACTAPVAAQNLIVNPGFESGTTGWDPLWVRTNGSGQGVVVSAPVHSGNAAYHITHNADSDWAFKQNNMMLVSPGSIYEFSVWANVVSPGTYSHITVAFFDAASNPITWEFTYQELTATNGTYQRFLIRFTVPPNVAGMWTRFIGAGNTDLYLDDVQLLFMGKPDNKICTLDNASLHLTINTQSLAMNVTDKRIAKTYSCHNQVSLIVQSVDSTASSLTFHSLFLPDSSTFDLQLSLLETGLKYAISATSPFGMTREFCFPDYIDTQPGDYVILPYAAGLLIPVEESVPVYTFNFGNWKSTMAFAGITNLTSGYMIISDDPWDSEIRFTKNDNAIYNGLRLFHQPAKNSLGYTRSGSLYFFTSGGYISMAQQYRKYAESLGYTRTFSEKAVSNPNIPLLQGAVDFWLMNYPFYDLRFIDSLRYSGLDKAIFSLYEGNLSTGAFSAFIDSINARQMLTSRYNDFVDVYPPTHPEYPDYRTIGYPGDILIQADGSMKTNWLSYLPGNIPFQAYFSCTATHAAHAKTEIGDELKTKHYNCRFIDVELAAGLNECFSPVHPQTRYDDALSRKALLQVVKDQCNLVTGDEECHDWAFPVTDYGEGTMTIVPDSTSGYDWSTPLSSPSSGYAKYSFGPAYRIPLHGLVYHDVHVPTWYTGDGISKVPAYWDDKDLFNILYASMPLFMPPTTEYWQQNKTRFLTSANLVTAVSRNCGFAKMIDHKFLTADKTVQSTAFDNGWSVTTNFGTNSYSADTVLLPAKGFFATNGSLYAGRFIQNNAPVEVTRLADRIFISSASDCTVEGLRTSGTAFLQQTEGILSLAFIGNQDHVDINPAQLPWPMKRVTVKTRYNTTAVIPQDVGDGWLRIYRTKTESFYIIEGTPTGMGLPGKAITKSQFALSQNFPNPFNPETTIAFELPKAGKATIKLYDLLGNEVRILFTGEAEAGRHSFVFNAATIPSGIYFYYLQFGEMVQAKKLIILK